jgi:hypothetical protein
LIPAPAITDPTDNDLSLFAVFATWQKRVQSAMDLDYKTSRRSPSGRTITLSTRSRIGTWPFRSRPQTAMVDLLAEHDEIRA